MIELAPKEYIIKCTYNEAMLYCFLMNINGKSGWRLPIKIERKFIVNNELDYLLFEYHCWYSDDVSDNRSLGFAFPVRDIL
jgi:hypothetical protein